MTAYNQKTIEKLAASRLKKVMSGLRRFRGGMADYHKYNRLFSKLHQHVSKGSANPLPVGTSFTQLYRRMQEAPKVSEKSLRLKDRLTGSVLHRTASPRETGKRPYEIKRGVSVTTDMYGDNSFRTNLQDFSKPNDTRLFARYFHNPRKQPVGHVSATDPKYTYRADKTPGRSRGIWAHELGEAVDSVPFIKKELGLQSPKASKLYPKGQGNNNDMIGKILGHNSVNPLLAERLHTGGRTLVNRLEPNPFAPYYAPGSREAERILRNVGNVGGYTPPPYGRAAGKASLQLEKRLSRGIRDIERDFAHRDNLKRRYEGRMGNMLGDSRYIPFGSRQR